MYSLTGRVVVCKQVPYSFCLCWPALIFSTCTQYTVKVSALINLPLWICFSFLLLAMKAMSNTATNAIRIISSPAAIADAMIVILYSAANCDNENDCMQHILAIMRSVLLLDKPLVALGAHYLN